jgi:hypothetical protein
LVAVRLRIVAVQSLAAADAGAGLAGDDLVGQQRTLLFAMAWLPAACPA